MTRWRVVRAPIKGDRPGSYAVLSDREPGPILGSRGGLHGWGETREPAAWLTFEQACLAAATGNGKVSTANMGPREADYAAYSAAPFSHDAHGWHEHRVSLDLASGPQSAAERAGAT